MIFARKINKISEFYMIVARKMSEFYIIIARKIVSRILGGSTCYVTPSHPTPVTYAYVGGQSEISKS